MRRGSLQSTQNVRGFCLANFWRTHRWVSSCDCFGVLGFGSERPIRAHFTHINYSGLVAAMKTGARILPVKHMTINSSLGCQNGTLCLTLRQLCVCVYVGVRFSSGFPCINQVRGTRVMVRSKCTDILAIPESLPISKMAHLDIPPCHPSGSHILYVA